MANAQGGGLLTTVGFVFAIFMAAGVVAIVFYTLNRGGKMAKTVVVFTGLLALLLFFFLNNGLPGLWSQGMGVIANNTKDYTDAEGHLVAGTFSIEIDLSDLRGNLGKTLYDDGKHKIYVSWVEKREQTGGIEIGFRSSGTYSLNGASLVSGVRHMRVAPDSFTSMMTANAKATFDGKHFFASGHGISGINYKDGDDFTFHFPMEGIADEQLRTGTLVFTVTDLYMNVRSKAQ